MREDNTSPKIRYEQAAIAYLGMSYLLYRSVNLLGKNDLLAELYKLAIANATPPANKSETAPNTLTAVYDKLFKLSQNPDFILGFIKGAQDAAKVNIKQAHKAAFDELTKDMEIKNPELAKYYKEYAEKSANLLKETFTNVASSFEEIGIGTKSPADRFLSTPKLPFLMEDNVITFLAGQSSSFSQGISNLSKVRAGMIAAATELEILKADAILEVGYATGYLANLALKKIGVPAWLDRPDILLPLGSALMALYQFTNSKQLDFKTAVNIADSMLMMNSLGEYNKRLSVLWAAALSTSYIGSAALLVNKYMDYTPFILSGGAIYGAVQKIYHPEEYSLITQVGVTLLDNALNWKVTELPIEPFINKVIDEFWTKYNKELQVWSKYLDRSLTVQDKRALGHMANFDVMAPKAVALTTEAALLEDKTNANVSNIVTLSKMALAGTTAMSGVAAKYMFLSAAEAAKFGIEVTQVTTLYAAIPLLQYACSTCTSLTTSIWSMMYTPRSVTADVKMDVNGAKELSFAENIKQRGRGHERD